MAIAPPRPDPTEDQIDANLRTAARGLMAERGVSQAKLAEVLRTSQSSVHHMLTNRQRGLTTWEVFWIETLCVVRRGTLYGQIGYVDIPTVEELVYEIDGITAQTAEAIVAAIQAVKANTLRTTGARP